jgi:hypothetical protein
LEQTKPEDIHESEHHARHHLLENQNVDLCHGQTVVSYSYREIYICIGAFNLWTLILNFFSTGKL